MRRWFLIATLWVLSLVLAGTLVRAQVRVGENNVISGADLGFVVEQQQRGVALGHFVVRINGQWMLVGPGRAQGHVVPAK